MYSRVEKEAAYRKGDISYLDDNIFEYDAVEDLELAVKFNNLVTFRYLVECIGLNPGIEFKDDHGNTYSILELVFKHYSDNILEYIIEDLGLYNPKDTITVVVPDRGTKRYDKMNKMLDIIDEYGVGYRLILS